MNNKEKYRAFCIKELGIPIFIKDWWLDAVCGKVGWDVAIVEKGGEIVGCLPYCLRSRKGFKVIYLPKLTQTMGPFIKYPESQKCDTRLAYEKEIFSSLTDQLPEVAHFCQSFNYSITNWLPFYWKGFRQTTRYTYVIESLENLDSIWKNFSANLRKEIRKAEKLVVAKTSSDLDSFYKLNKMTFDRQNLTIPYSFDFIANLDNVCAANNCRRIFFAFDSQNRIHAAIYLIWDSNSAYYLMGGGDPELRNSQAASLLMWEAIKFSATVTKKFDFEGSMIESVERFCRSFGTVQKPYFQIFRTSSKVYKLLNGLREILR